MNKMQWKLEFYDRFCRHEAELTQLYRELYHNDMAATWPPSNGSRPCSTTPIRPAPKP